MTIAVLSDTDNVASGGTFTLSSGCGLIVLLGGYQSSSTAVRTLTSITVTDGTNAVAGNVRDTKQRTSNARGAWAADLIPHASWVAGATLTLTLVWSGAMSGAASANVIQLSLSSAGTPFLAFGETENTQAVSDWLLATPAGTITPTVTGVQAGDFLGVVAIKSNTTNTFSPSTVPETYTETWDVSHTSGRIQTQYVIATLTGAYSPNIDPDSATGAEGVAIQVHYRENNSPSITAAATSPFNPGEAVTFTGTNLNAGGAGARIRKVGDATAFDVLTGYTPSGGASATATIPDQCTRTPYTSEDGVTHRVEYVATLAGVPNGTPTATLIGDDFIPSAPNRKRVTITVPDLSSESILSVLGWTAVAGDQIEWEALVTVSSTDVTIGVNPNGTAYQNSHPNLLPANVSFRYRAYDSAAKLWTASASNLSDWETATFGEPEPPDPGDSAQSEYPLLRHAQMRQARAGRVVAFSRRGGARR